MQILKKELLKFVSSPDQIVLFREIILSLCSHEEICTLANIDSKVEHAITTYITIGCCVALDR